jgi:hypothetical protein
MSEDDITYLRQRAVECRQLAQRTRVPAYRARWEEVARDLERRADELEQQQKRQTE